MCCPFRANSVFGDDFPRAMPWAVEWLRPWRARSTGRIRLPEGLFDWGPGWNGSLPLMWCVGSETCARARSDHEGVEWSLVTSSSTNVKKGGLDCQAARGGV